MVLKIKSYVFCFFFKNIYIQLVSLTIKNSLYLKCFRTLFAYADVKVHKCFGKCSSEWEVLGTCDLSVKICLFRPAGLATRAAVFKEI